MDIVLITGLWLPSSTWVDVAAELERTGHRPVPPALPGADDGSASASLDDQLCAALDGVPRLGTVRRTGQRRSRRPRPSRHRIGRCAGPRDGIEGNGHADRRASLPGAHHAHLPGDTAAQSKAWIDAGDVSELARALHVSFVDIDSGPWPMVTQRAAFTGLLDDIANGV